MNNRYLNKIINTYNKKLKESNIYGGTINKEEQNIDLETPLDTKQPNDILNIDLETPLESEQSNDILNIDLKTPLESEQSNDILNIDLKTPLESEQCDDIDLILQKIIPNTIKLDLPTESESETLTFFLYNMLSEEDNKNIYSYSLLDHILFNDDQKLSIDFFKNY